MPDFGQTAADYATHRPGFPDELFDRLQGFRIGRPGQRILDLGTGTGTMARGFARKAAEVIGLDRSPELLAQAERLARQLELNIRWVQGTAEETGLPEGAFDVVSAGQCWHWFDRSAAAREVRRLLAPGGRLVIAHYDWISLPGNVMDATDALILRYKPDLDDLAVKYAAGVGLYGAWLRELALDGFGGFETFSFDHDVIATHEAWRGRIRASANVGASLPADEVARFDTEYAALLAGRFPEDPLTIPHRCFVLVAEPR
ncbi:MAG TPA: class I SAM-dependent methyltransferase [bacterium]|nr:class I SAM-dependent methyltransferase [bacterium]